MSKSIYEEALKESKDFGSFVGLKLDKVNNALEQAKKQDRLVELYRELSKLKDDVIHLVMSGKDYEHLRVKTVKIEQQIKELEDEK